MKIHPSTFSLPKLLSVITLTISLICASAIAAPSQSKGDAALKQQVAELQAKIKQLEAALPANSPQPTALPAMPGMNTSPKMTPATSSMPSMTPSGSGTPGVMGMGDMNMGGMPKTPSKGESMTGGGMSESGNAPFGAFEAACSFAIACNASCRSFTNSSRSQPP